MNLPFKMMNIPLQMMKLASNAMNVALKMTDFGAGYGSVSSQARVELEEVRLYREIQIL